MKAGRAKRWAALVLPLVGAGGCATRAWRWDEDGGQRTVFQSPPKLPAHRAVERVTLSLRGSEFEFVGYRTLDPDARGVRAQLLLGTGISVLDVELRDGESRRISGGAFDAIPDLAGIATADLRRTWGSRSIFSAGSDEHSRVMDWGGGVARFLAGATDGQETFPVEPLADGSWLAVGYDAFRFGGPLRVTLLDADLVPEATIDYSDFDANGVPREIHLADLRDGHTLDVEVEEARVVPARDAAAGGP